MFSKEQHVHVSERDIKKIIAEKYGVSEYNVKLDVTDYGFMQGVEATVIIYYKEDK